MADQPPSTPPAPAEYHPLVSQYLQIVDEQIATAQKAQQPTGKLEHLRSELLLIDAELKSNPLTRNMTDERQLPPGVVDFRKFAELRREQGLSFLQKQGGYIDLYFTERLSELPDHDINEANLSKLAGFQRVAGEHLVVLRNYHELVPSDIPGIRHKSNLPLRDAIRKNLQKHAPNYLSLLEGEVIASLLLQNGDSSFFSFFDAGEAKENYGVLFSFLVRPTPARHGNDEAKRIYGLTGVELEYQPAEQEILKLETLIFTHRLSLQFREYVRDQYNDRENPAVQVERNAYSAINGIAAYMVMGGDQTSLTDYLHITNLSAAMLALDGEIKSHPHHLVSPFLLDWYAQGRKGFLNPQPGLNGEDAIAAYQDYAQRVWEAGYKGRYTGMQRYEMTIRASAEVLQRGNLPPDVENIVRGVLAAAKKFNPTLVERVLGSHFSLDKPGQRTPLLPSGSPQNGPEGPGGAQPT